MPATFLRQVEREWISKKTSNVTAQTRMGDLRRKYWAEYLGGNQAGKSLADLERAWLIKYIVTNLGTVSSTQLSDLWKTAVGVIVGQTAGRSINDNKIKFYTNAV